MKKTLSVLLFVIFLSFLVTPVQSQTQTFKEFAKDFISDGTASLSDFKPYCESKISTINDQGNPTKEKPSAAYEYLKYFFEFKKFKIKKDKIDLSDGEFTISIYFRQNSDAEWKLYKYDAIL